MPNDGEAAPAPLSVDDPVTNAGAATGQVAPSTEVEGTARVTDDNLTNAGLPLPARALRLEISTLQTDYTDLAGFDAAEGAG